MWRDGGTDELAAERRRQPGGGVAQVVSSLQQPCAFDRFRHTSCILEAGALSRRAHLPTLAVSSHRAAEASRSMFSQSNSTWLASLRVPLQPSLGTAASRPWRAQPALSRLSIALIEPPIDDHQQQPIGKCTCAPLTQAGSASAAVALRLACRGANLEPPPWASRACLGSFAGGAWCATQQAARFLTSQRCTASQTCVISCGTVQPPCLLASLMRRYPEIVDACPQQPEEVVEGESLCSNFYIDLNHIIHACTHPSWREVGHESEQEMFMEVGVHSRIVFAAAVPLPACPFCCCASIPCRCSPSPAGGPVPRPPRGPGAVRCAAC